MLSSLIYRGVTGIADDMVIYGKTDLEHDKHFDQLSQHLQKEHSDIESRQECNLDYHRYHSLDISGVPRG